MFDLDTVSFPFACPACGFRNRATMRQVRLGKRIICRGCRMDIQLVDHHRKARKARKDFENALSEFANVINLEIKL